MGAAKQLVEDSKSLASGAASGQEKLATSVQAATSTISRLTDAVKLGATCLGADDADTQVRYSVIEQATCPSGTAQVTDPA